MVTEENWTGPAGLTTLEVTAEAVAVSLMVEASMDVTTPRMWMRAPGEILEQVRPIAAGSTWSVTIPDARDGSVVSSGGYVHVGPGVTVIGNVVGSVVVSGGLTIIGGTPGTAGSGVGAVEVHVVVPSGMSLHSRLHAGSVTATGPLGHLHHRGHNATVDVDWCLDATVTTHNGTVRFGQIEGCLRASTHNGNVRVGLLGDDADVTTHNGNIALIAGSDAPIDARTHNGAITVYRNGYTPRVNASTHNGSKTIRG